ncbi:MAG: glycosyl hydrolase family 65 protein [Solirubrobacteraceae bacterium]
MSWIVFVPELRPGREAADEARLEHGDGRISIAGAPAFAHPACAPGAKAPGLFGHTGPDSDLLALPDPSRLGLLWRDGMTVARELDLRTGILQQRFADGDACAVVRSFCCLARPGTYVLRADGDAALLGDGPPLRAPAPVAPSAEARDEPAPQGLQILSVAGVPGGAVVAAAQERDLQRLERLAFFAVDPYRVPGTGEAVAPLHEAQRAGFAALAAEQREAWARRWACCEVTIEGDDELQHAMRFALFHLNALVASEGEAGLGARGTTAHAYRGHVFWDSEVFVLPFFAATHPHAARAMLRYRARRLHAARANAARTGHRGARFPWESAARGDEVTPTAMQDNTGEVVRVLTGELEEHVTADIAWAAAHYLAWTGDQQFARGGGLALLVETARYWASRVQRDAAGTGHIRHVIGPDEYHEDVDDNAYTNVMARWNLRAAAAHVERYGSNVLRTEAHGWLEIADALIDGFDANTRLYEQFAGFFDLEPLLATDLGPRPLSAPAIVGYDATHGSQLIKQTDVLMLHLNVPDQVAPASLAPNLDFYEPRTTHESSLSPGSTAEALARAGRPDQALAWLRLGAMHDLAENAVPARAGLHLAALGNTWRVVAFGLMGLWPAADALRVAPRLPSGWEALEVRVRYRDTPVRLRATPDALTVYADAPIAIAVGETPPVTLNAGGTRLTSAPC